MSYTRKYVSFCGAYAVNTRFLIFAFILSSKAAANSFCLLTYQNQLFSVAICCHSLVYCVFLFVSSVSMAVTHSVSSLSIAAPLTLCLSVFFQEEKGISCGLVDLDFLKCSVGFPFMRAQTKVAQPKVQLNSQCHRLHALYIL